MATDSQGRLTDWFRKWRMPLRKFLRVKTGMPSAELDDIAQEVFLRLMRYERADLIEHPQAYLFKTAANVAAEWRIRAHRRRPHEAKWLTNLPGGERPDEAVWRNQSQTEVMRAFCTLTPPQQEVLKLFFSEGLGHAEIAVRTGTSLRSVRRHFAKSYERLRRQLNTQMLGEMDDACG